jgi:integrase
MSYLRIPQNEYSKLLELDPRIIQANIIDYISFLRNSQKSSASIMMYLSAIRKFYEMNDITMLNWTKIHSYEGEHEKVADDRPYTHSEVQQMISHTSIRNRAIILMLWSSGVRVGAIPLMRIKDLEPIDQYNLYKVTVYPKSRKSIYRTYCSPEARAAIDSYFAWRGRWGDKLHEDEPLFRQDFDTSSISPGPSDEEENENPGLKRKDVKPIKVNTVRWAIHNILRNVGMRSLLPKTENNPYSRSAIMLCHGFRKAFEKNAYKAGMDHMYIRRLLGQKSGLEDSYLKLSDDELLLGDSKHVGYLGIVDQLTIDETHRLQKEIQTLRVQKSEMDDIKQQMAQFNEILNEFTKNR